MIARKKESTTVSDPSNVAFYDLNDRWLRLGCVLAYAVPTSFFIVSSSSASSAKATFSSSHKARRDFSFALNTDED